MSDARGPSPIESARLLRQRLEMGDVELFLGGLTRREALELVALAARGGDASAAGSSRRSGADSARSGTGAGSARPRTSSAAAAGPAKSADATAHPGAESAGGTARELSVLPDSYGELRATALGCTRCRLAEGRTQVVFSDGPPNARLMVVGEAPGANEDETGLPFVGAAGKYLDLLLRTVDLSREDSVYICNVLKCRPPGNRNPMPDEIEACSPFLRRQIELVRPEALLAVGSFAGQLLTGREGTSLGKLRGEVHSYHGVPLVVTYHPAALLRNAGWTRAFWDDLQLLRSVIDAR